MDSREKLLEPVLEQIAMNVAQTISHIFHYSTRGTRDSRTVSHTKTHNQTNQTANNGKRKQSAVAEKCERPHGVFTALEYRIEVCVTANAPSNVFTCWLLVFRVPMVPMGNVPVLTYVHLPLVLCKHKHRSKLNSNVHFMYR